MTGINQGVPETAIGEPIRLGSNNEFEIEQHPISDRLIIRDTVNGKVAYVRKERGGEIGGDGVLVKALKEGKPMADDGRTYETIQQAEREANGWVFVPPGTFNESVSIDTEGLTLKGSGYSTFINSSSGQAVLVNKDNVTISSIRTDATGDGIDVQGSNGLVENCDVTSNNEGIVINSDGIVTRNTVHGVVSNGIRSQGSNVVIAHNNVTNSGRYNIFISSRDSIAANNIADGTTDFDGIRLQQSTGLIVIGNRVLNSNRDGIQDFQAPEAIVANNRVSDSGSGTDIDISSSGTLLDANLTGASN